MVDVGAVVAGCVVVVVVGGTVVEVVVVAGRVVEVGCFVVAVFDAAFSALPQATASMASADRNVAMLPRVLWGRCRVTGIVLFWLFAFEVGVRSVRVRG